MTDGPLAPAPAHAPAPRSGPSFVFLGVALGLGLLLGASCVTCARLPLDKVGGEKVLGGEGPRVGVIEILGPISDMDESVRRIRDFAKRDDIEALVVRIDSPGGSVAPSQQVYRALRFASESMPVVASMGTVAASGGFWISLGADWVLAESGSITGSIGVISQLPDLRGIADRVDFRLRTFKSGPVKDLGNPLRELTERDREVLQGLVDDLYDQFVSLTIERRGLTRDQVLKLADGQVMSGRRALEEGLVDELGGLYAAARRAAAMVRDRAEGAETSSTAPARETEEPALVYPKEPGPKLLEYLGARLESGVAAGIGRALGGRLGGIEALDVR
ncbi:MAG: signal peptide peptidase SppA [Myxococcota bacterium]